MSRPRQLQCKRGHLYNEKSNTSKGRSCYACQLLLLRLKYRNDSSYREKKKASAQLARRRGLEIAA